jgi:glycosyltransferase involved in cell wall biosynthesis
MMLSPRISVIMPVFDDERTHYATFLRPAIDSVLTQTYGDFEFIIVSDFGTSRESIDIIQSYTDSRIRHFKNSMRLGIAGSRNFGLKEARGEYIAVMDADDASVPHRFEKEVSYLDTHPNTGVVGTGYATMNENGKVVFTTGLPTTPALTHWLLLFGSPIVHSSAMIRRAICDYLGGYRVDLPFGEDYDFWIRASHVTEIVRLSGVFTYVRIHGRRFTDSYERTQLRRFAAYIARPAITEILGYDIDEQLTRRLFQTTDRSPLDSGYDISEVAGLLKALCLSYNRRYNLSIRDKRCVSIDVLERMLRLAGVNLSSWPARSIRAVLSALAFQPAIFIYVIFRMLSSNFKVRSS